MNNRFIITTPFYNAEKYIANCLSSIKTQTYDNFICIVTNDNSTDQSYNIALDIIKNDDRFIVINNTEKKDVMFNLVNAINHIKPNNEDIIVNVDGDDWLANKYVIETVNDAYMSNNILMTYGNYITYPCNTEGYCSEYSEEVIQHNLYRKDKWRASHLRTFKYKLWKGIKEEDLKDNDNCWIFPCADQAIMFPMLEMSGGMFYCFNEILYVYNRENLLNACKIRRQQQADNEKLTRSRKPYVKLYF